MMKARIHRKVKCPKCFKEVKNISEHIKMVHDKVFDVFCKICDASFSRNSCLNQHVKKVHDRIEVVCTKCDKSFTSSYDINRHNKVVHDKIRVCCTKCDKSFRWKHDLDRHFKVVHRGFKVHCIKCDKSFARQDELYCHIKGAHDGIKVPCTKCDKKFIRNSELNQHLKQVHKIKKNTSKVKYRQYHNQIPMRSRKLDMVLEQNIKLEYEVDITCQVIGVLSNRSLNSKTDRVSFEEKAAGLDIKKSYIQITCPVVDCFLSFESLSHLSAHLKEMHKLS